MRSPSPGSLTFHDVGAMQAFYLDLYNRGLLGGRSTWWKHGGGEMNAQGRVAVDGQETAVRDGHVHVGDE